jgi:prophage regulatory protein
MSVAGSNKKEPVMINRFKLSDFDGDPCRLLSAKQLAHLLSVHVISIWRMAKDGRLPAPIKIGSNTTRWRAADIAAWLDEKEAN